MPERKTVSVLSRTIGVALVTGLKVELLLLNASAQHRGITINAASVPETFSQPNRGLFDHEYMRGVVSSRRRTGKEWLCLWSQGADRTRTAHR